jgi:methylglutaconyl-CoA hydratase
LLLSSNWDCNGIAADAILFIKPFSMESYVRSEHHRGIATLEFFHPKGNCLPISILQQLTDRVKDAAADEQVKVILLRSAGDKTFCAGASFDELAAIKSEQEGLRFFSGFAHLINAMRTCPKFIVARIQGKCVGGGVGLAAAADYAIASIAADIRLSELTIGIGPFVVGPAVERKIGVAAFTELAMDARQWRDAEWAHRKGLFQGVYEAPDTMESKLYSLLKELSQYSADSMAALKQSFWGGTAHWEQLLLERAAISSRLILSPQARQAIAAVGSE